MKLKRTGLVYFTKLKDMIDLSSLSEEEAINLLNKNILLPDMFVELPKNYKKEFKKESK